MGRGISNEFVVWCKIRLVGTWMKRREEVDRTGRVKSEMLREEQDTQSISKTTFEIWEL